MKRWWSISWTGAELHWWCWGSPGPDVADVGPCFLGMAAVADGIGSSEAVGEIDVKAGWWARLEQMNGFGLGGI